MSPRGFPFFAAAYFPLTLLNACLFKRVISNPQSPGFLFFVFLLKLFHEELIRSRALYPG